MNNMRKLQLTFCAIVLSLWTIAQNYQTIYTTTGAIYKGYIAEQIPGNIVSIYATDVILSLPIEGVTNINKEYRIINELSPAAQHYFLNEGDSLYTELSSLQYNDEIYDNVLILNQTTDSISIRFFNTRTYTLPWKSIFKVEEQNDTLINLWDIITLKSGEEYKGKVISQTIGKELTLQTQDTTINIIPSNIKEISVENNTNTNILTLPPLLDRIILKNDSILEGFILSRTMGQNMRILTNENIIEIPLIDIKCYQKVQNPYCFLRRNDNTIPLDEEKTSFNDLIY